MSIVLVTLTLLHVAVAVEARDRPLGTIETPAALYRYACAACHGADGTGNPATTVGFDVPLPDFTDCSFASREPMADWYAVAHEGGPVRGFDRMMPAFAGALTSEQMEKAVQHIKSLCQDTSWPRGELNLPRPIFTEKAFPEDEFVWTTAVAAEGSGAIVNAAIYEKRFGARNQFEIVAPFAFEEQTDGSWSGGVGDLALSYKRVLGSGQKRGAILSVLGEVIIPTGDEAAGLGDGATVFELFLAYGQILPRDLFLQMNVGVELPTDTQRVSREGLFRVAFGQSYTQGQFGRTWSPMIEVLGGTVLRSRQQVQWDVAPQLQVTLNTRQHIMASIGVRVPVTDSDTRTTWITGYLLWDWFDGGFFDGW
jgi:hypothetical protein